MTLSLVATKPRLMLSLVFLTGCLTLLGVSARLSKFLPMPTSLHCLAKTVKMIHDRDHSVVLSQQNAEMDDLEIFHVAEAGSETAIPIAPFEPELTPYSRRRLSSHHFKRPPPVQA
ncbi:MAG: hypothetical protein SF339_02305 [Blastocatellia bacterium]|nr:hypothetical protein [Blastocatellia bacterium]